jgi:hypothetical protein
MPEDAVIDAVEEVIEPIEGVEAVEGEETPAGEETEGSELSGAPLWQAIKNSFNPNTDKKTVEQVRKGIYALDQAGKLHPEGIKGVSAVLESVKRLSDDAENPDAVPVEQMIDDTLSERTFWRDFDTKFQAGDPALVGEMATANAEAFQKLVPEALNKFAELNPDGYSSLIAKAAAGYFGTEEIQKARWTLDSIIPQTSDDPAVQRLIEGYTVIKNALNGLSAMAAKPIATPTTKTAATEPQRTTPGEDPAMRLRDIEWNATIAPTSNGLMVSEATKVLGNAKLTAPEIDKLRGKFKEEINARVGINPGYQNALKAYLKANNKAAYLQRVNSEHKKIITGAAKRLVDDVLAERKTAPKAGVTKPSITTKPAVEGAIRYERIAGPPQTQNLKVDLAKTPQSMLVKRQAYIQGRKNPVTWGPK